MSGVTSSIRNEIAGQWRRWRTAAAHDAEVRRWHLPFFALVAGAALPWLVRGLGAIFPRAYDDWVLPFWFDGVLAGRWIWMAVLLGAGAWRGGPQAASSRALLDGAGGMLFGAAWFYDWWYPAPVFTGVLFAHLLWRQLVRFWAFPLAGAAALGFLAAGFALTFYVDGRGAAWIDRRLGLGFPPALAATLVALSALVLAGLVVLLFADRLFALPANRRRLRRLIEAEPRASRYFAIVRQITPRTGVDDPWNGADTQFAPAAVATELRPANTESLAVAPAALAWLRTGLQRLEAGTIRAALTFAGRFFSQRAVARLVSLCRPRGEGVPFPSEALRRVLGAARADARERWHQAEAERLRTRPTDASPAPDESEALVRYVLFTEAAIEAEAYFLHPRRVQIIEGRQETLQTAARRWASVVRHGRRVCEEPGADAAPSPEWAACARRYAQLWNELFSYALLSWPGPAIGRVDLPVDLQRLAATWRRLEFASTPAETEDAGTLSLQLAFALWDELGARLPLAPADETRRLLRALGRHLRRQAPIPAARSETDRIASSAALVAACYVVLDDPLGAVWVVAPFEAMLHAQPESTMATVAQVAAARAAWAMDRRPSTPEAPELAVDFGNLSFSFNRYGAACGKENDAAARERSVRRFARGLAAEAAPAPVSSP